MKSIVMKEIAGKQIPAIRANSQIIKIQCKNDELATLALKYNELIGKDLINQSWWERWRYILHQYTI